MIARQHHKYSSLFDGVLTIAVSAHRFVGLVEESDLRSRYYSAVRKQDGFIC